MGSLSKKMIIRRRLSELIRYAKSCELQDIAICMEYGLYQLDESMENKKLRAIK